MRRILAVLIAGLVFFSIPVSRAESIRDWFQNTAATATPSPNDFRFRDGIRWGMNKQQVKALETVPMTERSTQNWSIMLTNGKVAVSKYTADLVFIFRDDQLMMICYEFPQGTPESFLYLTGALSSLYGMKEDAEPQKIKFMMDEINRNRYKAEQITQASCWQHADGTTIYLYYFSPTDFAIMYVSPQMAGNMYQINGL